MRERRRDFDEFDLQPKLIRVCASRDGTVNQRKYVDDYTLIQPDGGQSTAVSPSLGVAVDIL